MSLAILLVSVAAVQVITAVAHPASVAAVPSVAVTAPPATYPNMGCGTRPLYNDATPRQDFLCGSAPNKTFRAGPNDVVFARGPGATIHAANAAPNQIHGKASDTAFIDKGIDDCPVYGIVKIIPSSCVNSVKRQRQSPSPAAPTTTTATTTTTTTLTKAADCVPPGSDVESYGWRPQLLGVCHFTIPPDVKCEVLNGQRIVLLTDTTQMAAQDANPGVVDWQIAAWSMVILQLNPATYQWQAALQTPWYWAEPTDIFDVPIAKVLPDNWRRFGSGNDGTPALIANQPLLLPSAGQYRFQIFEKWYAKPRVPAGLESPQATEPGPGFVLTPFHVSARWGAEELPLNPHSSPDAQQFQAAVCQFS